ncbi:acyl-CoA desaturase [Roseibium aggregatum]|nr:acyl-CoA desaturase [Roseibium aggregatum]
MTATALIAGPLTFSWQAFALFLVLTAITICGGHSVGMHRLLIHRSFRTVPWVERFLVWLGVLVGMAGPFGMIRLHDFRDWGQRQSDCHEFFSHRSGFWKDAYWQLCCGIVLDREPIFRIEDNVANDRFYRLVEKTWMVQQLVVAVPLYLLGGLPFVVWGICCRVSVSLIGHWLVGYYAHQPKDNLLYVEGASVQGYNLPKFGVITFGEAFHENHHAFPKSARLGFLSGQTDPGWWLVMGLERLGLAWDVNTPETLEARTGLTVSVQGIQSLDGAPGWLRSLPVRWRGSAAE